MSKVAKVEALKERGGNLPGIYAIHHLPSNQWYVGQTKGRIVDRIYQHINNKYAPDESQQEISKRSHIDSVFQMIKNERKDEVAAAELINRHFNFYVKFCIPDLQDYNEAALKNALNVQEANYIKEYDSEQNGFNQTAGNHSEVLAKDAIYRDLHQISLKLFQTLLTKI